MRVVNLTLAVAVALCVWTVDVQADVYIDTVTVGNPGNAGELAGGIYWGPERICGAVDYVYNVGKFEITAGQYAEFLNAVGAADTYGLYNADMWSSDYGCRIQRTGSAGSYTYSVASDWADRPVNYVSWGDTVRFANWMHNGQPTGAQDLSTTEDGSYYVNGATTVAELQAIVREPDATWVLTSEDEWYKAAYHKNDGVTGNYWDYPACSDALPDNGTGGDTGNSANYFCGGFTIGPPFYRTDVGYFGLSESPYNTFDQGGNIFEWNESILDTSRGLRGASFFDGDTYLFARTRSCRFSPTHEFETAGFRVAQVPEPATVVMLTLGGIGLVRRR